MGAAKNEAEVLEHMGRCFRKSGGLIGPASESEWSTEKAKALLAAEAGRPFRSVLDVGIGDQTPVTRWVKMREPGWPERYIGVDGCEDVIEKAAKTHPQGCYLRTGFSNLVGEHLRPDFAALVDPAAHDAVLLFDVLYHVPDGELCRRLFDWAFGAQHCVALTYATKRQEFGGTRPGEAGFAWFPRPEIKTWIDAAVVHGWEIAYETSNFKAGPQQQRLVALVRT